MSSDWPSEMITNAGGSGFGPRDGGKLSPILDWPSEMITNAGGFGFGPRDGGKLSPILDWSSGFFLALRFSLPSLRSVGR